MNNAEKLYELALTNDVITDDLLLANGFTDNEISRLKMNKFIEELPNKEYRLSNLKSLFTYFLKFVETPDYRKRLDVLNLILKYFPNDLSSLRNKAFVCTRLGKHREAMKTFSQYYVCKDKIEPNDVLILYLLSKLANPGFLTHELDDLDISAVSNGNYYEDKLRQLMLDRKFSDAFQYMSANNWYTNNASFDNLFIKSLLRRISDLYSLQGYYKSCIVDGRYEDALYILQSREELRGYDELIRDLLYMIIHPKRRDICTIYPHENGLWEAIYANDFDEALRLNEKYNRDKDIDDITSPISILLRRLISLRNKYATGKVSEDLLDIYYYEPTYDDKYLCVYAISNLINDGLTFIEALDKAPLTYGEKGFVALVYARESYRNNNMDLGDYFVKIYEGIYNMGTMNKELYQRIKEDKYSFVNEESDLSKTLNMPKSPKNK